MPRLKALCLALGLSKDRPEKGNPYSSKCSREESSSLHHSKEMRPHTHTSSFTSRISGITSRFSGFSASFASTVDTARASDSSFRKDDMVDELCEHNGSFNKGIMAVRDEQKCEETMALPGDDDFDDALDSLQCREGPETMMQTLGDVLDAIAEEATDDGFDTDMREGSHDSDRTDYDPQETIKPELLIDHAVKLRIGRSPRYPDIEYQQYSQYSWNEKDLETGNQCNPSQEPCFEPYGGYVRSPNVSLDDQEFVSKRIHL